MTSRPRVLAFADVRGSVVAACRLVAPLQALRDAGLIASFTVTDATLRGAPRAGAFDAVWLQRGADAWLTGAIAERLPGGYLFDIDDDLLCRPAYLAVGELPDPAPLIAALASCAVLTTPSSRLRDLLERRSGVPLTARSKVCANAVPFAGRPLVERGRPAAVLLTQSHRLALTDSRDEVLAAIADGAARHRLPLWSLGAHAPALQKAAAGAGATLVKLRPRDWTTYHASLAGPPALLGVAPLETHGDADTVEFAAGKSDVKMVEYGGFGHSAVYSDAAPYLDTDLTCGRVVGNRYDAWTDAIGDLMRGGWQDAAAEARGVRERRELARIAEEQWWPALEAALLARPVDAAQLFSELDRLGARVRDRAARVRWRADQVVWTPLRSMVNSASGATR